MPTRTPSILLAAIAFSAFAADPAPAPVQAPGDIFWVRARYGVALRQGTQTDIGPGLSYTGMTPNDVALASGFYPGAGFFGMGLSAQREAFALLRSGVAEPVTGGALLRGYAGPSARIGFGPLKLEALAGYGLAQLPSFGNSVSPTFSPAMRHGPAFAARALVDLPWGLRLEARGEYPLGLFAQDAAGTAATATGFAAGASLTWWVGSTGRFAYGLVADYQFVTDTISVGQEVSATQTISRAGLALEIAFLDRVPPPPPPKHGDLRFTVVDADTGQALPAPKVMVTVKGRAVKFSEQAGVYHAAGLDPGAAVVKVALGGYLPAEGSATIVAGREEALELRVKKEPPKVGALQLILVDKQTAAPVKNAVVTIGEQRYETSPAGTLLIKDLPPGPVAMSVTAAGYVPKKEVASVVVFKTSTMPVEMVQVAKKLPAIITGTVRNIRGGKAVEASLEIPQAQVKTLANEDGKFTIRLEGGTYSVTISAPGFLTQKKKVTVKDGDRAIFNVDLHPDLR